MAVPPDLLEVGRIDRPHGLRGDVLVSLLTERVERVAPDSVLQTDSGPLTVVASRPHQHRWIVKFAGVEDRTAAERCSGVVLYAERIDDPDTLWVHVLVGCRVVDADGIDRGRVEALQDNPASDLLVLDTGALVPLRFMVDGPTGGVIRVDTPTGLFDL